MLGTLDTLDHSFKFKRYSCVVYDSNCSCGESYVDESVRKVV